MRGRKPDPASQDQKGNPGKRKKRSDIEVRLRQLLEAPPSSSDPLSPPAILGLEEFAGAIRIWNEYAPTLSKRNILDRLDRHSLAMFCYYLDRFWSAVKTLATEGETQKVKTVAGGFMLRDHPAVRQRKEAADMVFDLSSRFGFTPLDRHKLIREIAGAGVPLGSLFGDDQPSEQTSPADDPFDITGFAARNAARPN